MKVLDHLGLGMWSLYAAMAWSTENTTTHPHWSEIPYVCHITSYVCPMLFLNFPFYPIWITTSPFHFVVGRIWLLVKTNMDKKSGSELELPGFEARLHLMGMCPQGCDRASLDFGWLFWKMTRTCHTSQSYLGSEKTHSIGHAGAHT